MIDAAQVHNVMNLTGTGEDIGHGDDGSMIDGAYADGELSEMSAVTKPIGGPTINVGKTPKQAQQSSHSSNGDIINPLTCISFCIGIGESDEEILPGINE